MGSDPLYLFLSIMKLAGALVGIIATAFSLELKYS